MIQDIAPHTYDPTFRKKAPEEQDFVLHYEYNKVMLLRQGEGYVIPTFRDLLDEEDVRPGARYLFCIDDRAYYLVTDMGRCRSSAVTSWKDCRFSGPLTPFIRRLQG